MVAIGLVILLVAGAATLDIVLENTKTLSRDPQVIGQTLSHVNVGGFFVAGVLTGIGAAVGLALLLKGLARSRRRRQERRELTRSYAGSAQQAESLEAERTRLAHELEQERIAREQAETRGNRPVAPPSALGEERVEQPRSGSLRSRLHKD